MHSKIILFFIIILISGFFYLHTVNQYEVTYVLTPDRSFTVPVTVLVFAGFIVGVALMVFNSIYTDAKRAVREIRSRRERRLKAQAEKKYRDGVDALVRGDARKAVELLEKAREHNPGSREIALRLADAFMALGNPARAGEVLEDCLAHNPDDMEVLFRLASSGGMASDNIHREKYLREILRLDRSNVRALVALRDLKVSEEDWDEAVKLQKDLMANERAVPEGARETEKNILAGLHYEAASRFLAEDRLDDAENEARQALRTDDGFVPAHLLLGELCLKRGDTAGAIKVLESAYEKTRHVIFLLRLEEIYLEESNPGTILSLYKRVVDENPEDVTLRLVLARLYLRLEMVDNALEELEAMEGLDGFYTKILLAEAYLRRNQAEKAAELLLDVISLDRDLSPPFKCSTCGHTSRKWLSRCPDCREWGTFDVDASSSKGIPLATLAYQSMAQ